MILRVTAFLALLIFAEANRYTDEAQWQEFEEYLKWKKTKDARGFVPRDLKNEASQEIADVLAQEQQNPPPADRGALMGRYIVNQADWVSVATISTRKEIESFPTVNLVSFSDGPLGNGSGIPYLYLTPLDFTAQDLAKDHRATLMMTLAQGDFCKGKQYDPMDPRCARILLSGKIKALKNESQEHEIAKKAVFTRHPKLVNMPANHHFFFAKLKILNIAVLDTFGGPKYVPIKDYLNPPVANVTEEFLRLFPMKESLQEYEYRSV